MASIISTIRPLWLVLLVLVRPLWLVVLVLVRPLWLVVLVLVLVASHGVGRPKASKLALRASSR